MKKNMAKLVPNFTRQASLLGVVFRIRGKLTIASLIRVLLCAAVCTAFLGNIIFLLETRKMNSESEKNFIDRKNLGRISLRDRDVAGSKMEETTNKGYLDIEVYSSKENASVVVNGKIVYQELNRLGMNVVVLNQNTGAVTARRRFDTYSTNQESTEMMEFISGLPDGRILCLTVKDEATISLLASARSYLQSRGSSYIQQLQWRDMWAFVTQRVNNKNMVYAEGYQQSPSNDEWATPVRIHTTVPISEQSTVDCQWIKNDDNRRRKEFCDKFDGYEEICKCENPEQLAFEPPLPPDGSRINLPLLIMASNRPYYLYRMLKTLRQVQGLNHTMVTVFIDGFFEEPALLAGLYGLNVDQQAGVSERRARISQHYKRSLTASFARHADASVVVILEEDLDVSPDILTFFNQLLPVLENDDSLYCISAWNDQGYTHAVKDPAMTYRVETMPGLGWVLERKLYKEELEPQWPGPDVMWDWDMWVRSPQVRKGRECIIPDISRTYHFGARGLNVNPYMQRTYFSARALNTEPNVTLNVDIMYKERYEKELQRLLRKAVVLDHSRTPCTNPNDFIPLTKNKIYVFYIRMDSINDFTTWSNVANCLKIWDLDPRGFHKRLWRLWLKDNHVLIVGCPVSPYCNYKPSRLQPIHIPKKKKS
nr:protein O-linked-mannose beta-1,2-N-acetylglucosaminyltransferase 1-like [Pocillopora verrucosa]